MDEQEDAIKTATFAGGCFWCMQHPFDRLDGVISTVSGYIGGTIQDPTYEQVCSGRSGHAEAVEVRYDTTKVSYSELLEVFWTNINPTTLNRQFSDAGTQYRTEIFFHDDEQKSLAEASRHRLAESGRFDKPIVTQITPASRFYKAESYHQDYYRKHPGRYAMYRLGSGRDEYLNGNQGAEP